MARSADLDKLLSEVDSLTGNAQAQIEYEQQRPSPATKESSFLSSIGGFFISKVDEQPAHVDVPPPSPNTVEEVSVAEPTPEFAVPENNADDLSNTTFADIYSAAGVDENDFTVDKLAILLDDPTLKDQPMTTKTLVVKMALKAQNVSPETPVTDAVRRDLALDGYQKMLNSRATEAETQNMQLIQQINEEVKTYLEQKNAEIDSLRTETQEMRRQADTFAHRRQTEEQRLAALVVPLLEGKPNPISVGNQSDEKQ
ncbi:MAG: hypothetical protein ABI954_15610 [Pyrinomonadaceae bacterium]